MKKIMLIPLDERPCNYNYTAQMAGDTDFSVILPPKSILPQKKTVGNHDSIARFMLNSANDCCGAIVSIDALVYTGIIPSRLHDLSVEEMRRRAEKLRQLKLSNPQLKLYAFSLIMRCPSYSSGDEEPDYYEEWGRQIHRYGVINHKISLSIATREEKEELAQINKKLPKKYLNDYIERRNKNIQINEFAIDLAAEGIIDFLIIPQDDSAPYGFTAQDQKRIRAHIAKKEQQFNVYMYPDADAVENTLLARMINKSLKRCPLIYPKFASGLGHSVIPPYEDRPVIETIKYQIMAAGGLVATSASEADIILMLNTPNKKFCEASDSAALLSQDYAVNRTQLELLEYADYAVNVLHKPVCFADIALANGGDKSLFELLRIKGLLYKLAGYAGWNTSSNTLGTAIPMSILYWIYGMRQAHLDALALRYLEDIGYMSVVRADLCDNYLKDMGLNNFQLDGARGKANEIIKQKLEAFAEEKLTTDIHTVAIRDCFSPWNRTFETGLEISVRKKKEKVIFVTEK